MDSDNGGMDDAEGSSEITAQFHDTANSCRNPYGLISLWRIHQQVIKSPSLLLKGKGDGIQTDAIYMHLRQGLSFIYHVINLHPITK